MSIPLDRGLMNAVFISRATGRGVIRSALHTKFRRSQKTVCKGLCVSFVVVVELSCFSLLYFSFIFHLEKLIYPSAIRIKTFNYKQEILTF